MNESNHRIRPVTWHDEQQAIRNIREEVFIIEQNVPQQLEWDGEDETAMHVLADREGIPVATGRLLRSGQIGRMAVLRQYRRQGIGSAILQALLELAHRENVAHVFLNAQLQARGFYLRHGFVQRGEYFDDAGIMHCRMEYRPE